MGALVFVILGLSAIAVDASLIGMAHLQVQATADAASHAALVAYRSNLADNAAARADAKAAAEFMLKRNDVALGNAHLDRIDFGSYDRATDTFCVGCSSINDVNAIDLDVSRKSGNAVQLWLAPLFGVTTHEVVADAITAHQKRAIMLVQDFSCSMNGGAIDLSRQASVLFLDYMVAQDQPGDLLGLAGYAEFGAVEYSMDVSGAMVMGFDGYDGTMSSTVPKATVGTDPAWAKLSRIATEEAYLRDRLAGICDTEVGCPDDPTTKTLATKTVDDVTTGTLAPRADDIGTCTNPAIAMEQAIEQFLQFTDPTYFRGMVVMSDGEFNCGGGDGQARAAADKAYNLHDIHIWTVLYHNGSFDMTDMQALTRGYGFFQMSPDPADLPVMYAAIAAALPTSIVD